MPTGIFFAPDGRSQRQRRGERGSFLEAEPIAHNLTAVVVFDGREPGLVWLTSLIEQQDGKLGVVGLPHRIGVAGLTTVEQVKLLPVGSSPLVSHRHQCRIEGLDDLTHPFITGRLPSLLVGNSADLPMDGGCRTGRRLQSQSLYEPDGLLWQATRGPLV